jgi:putative transposase
VHRGPRLACGLPEAITTVWELATVETRVIYLIRNNFRYAPRQH